MNSKRILLTGGHAATTAIAVVEELIRRNLGEEVYWVGGKEAIEGKKNLPLEFKVLPQMGVRYFSITTGKLHRKLTIWTIPSLFKIPIGIIQAFKAVFKIRPSLILSFGGAASFPVVFAGWILGVPILIHEQTAAAGLANRLAAFFATEVLLARKESEPYFSNRKTNLVGNPVMTQIAEVEPKKIIDNPPTIFITTGSRGSQIINKVVKECLNKLLEKYRIIHVSGEIDYAEFKDIKNTRYEVYDWVDPLKIDGLYRQADIVIGRAGANTTAELMVTKRPCLLIPIPWSYLNEQNLNAEIAMDFGIAKILNQADLNSETLIKGIYNLEEKWQEIKENTKNKSSEDTQASKMVVDIIQKYLR
jgi:UDP-N-acetylglucosamine--N-acetylmuramyl-(pentapeptide) pyrophosphoryl-undecaprenol N-acetylglucosamine transferase